MARSALPPLCLAPYATLPCASNDLSRRRDESRSIVMRDGRELFRAPRDHKARDERKSMPVDPETGYVSSSATLKSGRRVPLGDPRMSRAQLDATPAWTRGTGPRRNLMRRGGHKPGALLYSAPRRVDATAATATARSDARSASRNADGCPAHQEAIWVREGRRPGHCPRLPRSQLLDVGVDHGGMMGP